MLKITLISLFFVLPIVCMEPDLNNPLVLFDADLCEQALNSLVKKFTNMQRCTEFAPVEEAFVQATALMNNPHVSSNTAFMNRIKTARAHLFKKLSDAYVNKDAAIKAQQGLADDFYGLPEGVSNSLTAAQLPVTEVSENVGHPILKLLSESHANLKKEFRDGYAALQLQLQNDKAHLDGQIKKERQQLEAELKRLEEEHTAQVADSNRNIARLERENLQLHQAAVNHRRWRNVLIGGVAATAAVGLYVAHKRANAQTVMIDLATQINAEDKLKKSEERSKTPLIVHDDTDHIKTYGLVESLGNTVRYILDFLKGINSDMADVRRRVVVLENGQTIQEQINATNGQRLIDVENRSYPVNLGRSNRFYADVLGIQNSDGTVNQVLDAAISRKIIPSKPRRSSDTA